jgi:molybdopterin synthase catalytic subunit
MIAVTVQRQDFDAAAESRALTQGRSDVGAVVSFVGLCRGESNSLAALELEHYPGMAEAEISRVAEAAAGRWPLDGLRVIHRHGVIRPGENIVLVIAASRHRDAAFEAARYVMDYLKTQAPFWKKNHLADGTAGGWVDAREADDAAAARWNEPASGVRPSS